MLDQEEEILFKEKEEIENPKEDTDDCFVPAKEVQMNPEEALVYFEL